MFLQQDAVVFCGHHDRGFPSQRLPTMDDDGTRHTTVVVIFLLYCIYSACDLSLTICDLQLRVFFLFFFSLLFVSFFSRHKIISPLSRLQKKLNLLFFRPQNTHFSFSFSLSLPLPRGQITTTQRERNVRLLVS